jgi:hypothetical protein
MKNIQYLFVLLIYLINGFTVFAENNTIENHSMNKINATAILFTGNNENLLELRLLGNEGNYRFECGYNTVIVDYWGKTVEYDSDYRYDNKYYPEEYIQMERNITNGINSFKSIFFNQNIRQNEKNGVIFVDSFCFSVFEAESIFLSRRIYLSTNNHNIRITIYGSNELVKKVIEEAPDYFKIRSSDGKGDIEYNDITKEIGRIVWDYKNNAIIMFGNDLINGIHKSETVNDWFFETETILNGIKIM